MRVVSPCPCTPHDFFFPFFATQALRTHEDDYHRRQSRHCWFRLKRQTEREEEGTDPRKRRRGGKRRRRRRKERNGNNKEKQIGYSSKNMLKYHDFGRFHFIKKDKADHSPQSRSDGQARKTSENNLVTDGRTDRPTKTASSRFVFKKSYWQTWLSGYSGILGPM